MRTLTVSNKAFASKTSSIIGVVLFAAVLIFLIGLSVYWSNKPDIFDVVESASDRAQSQEQKVVVGYTTTNTLVQVANTLLHKPGGFISNDVGLPGVWLDNITNWEFGVLVQVRDMSRALRKDFSRSQSQSQEDPDVAVA